MSYKNNNTRGKLQSNPNLLKIQAKPVQIEKVVQMNRQQSLPDIVPQLDEDQSQFLELNEEMKERLDNIDRKKSTFRPPKRKQGISRQKRLNKSVDHIVLPTMKKDYKQLEHKKVQDRQVEKKIKKQYVHKMKEWSKQKQELQHKKHVLENHKKKVMKERQEHKRKEKQDQESFYKLQKKKQLEQKINQIQERRKRREDSLKNAVLKRSYNGVPKYLEYEQKFSVKEEEKVMLDLKLMKNKKEKMKMDPEELKKHERAYIQRIKDRLNIKPKKQSLHRQTSSDFNLYLKKSEELKKVELQKIIRRKKFQEKLSKMEIKVDEDKKRKVQISRDKSKYPQKYHILERKSLNDEQIYNEFRGVQIELDPKKKGNDYLNKLKQSPRQPLTKNQVQQRLARSQELQHSLSPRGLPKIDKKKIKPEPTSHRSEHILTNRKPSTVRSFSQLSEGQTFSRNLLKTKERDSKYMSALRDKLAFLDK